MSWSISSKGTVAKVREALKAEFEKEYPRNDMVRDGHGFVPAFIDEQLAKMEGFVEKNAAENPTCHYNGVSVEASGSGWHGGSNLKIEINVAKFEF